MPADFFTPGEIQVFSKPRWYHQWGLLGTAITSPHIRGELLYRNVESERVQPGPYNKMFQTEQHVVSMVLNRVNFRHLNRMKDVGRGRTIGGNWKRFVRSGNLVMGSTDAELFIRYARTWITNVPAPPDGASRGRLYYSSTLLVCEEDAPSRTQEVALVFECNPLPINHSLYLFSEDEADFPTVTVE